MIKEDPKERLKSQLSEAILTICKSWAIDGKVDLTVEGLIAITIEKDVALINMKERVVILSEEGGREHGDFSEVARFSGNQFGPELDSSPSDDMMQNLGYAFVPFLARDDCDMLDMDVTDGNHPSKEETEDQKLKGQEDMEDDNLLKGSLDYTALSLADSAGLERFPFDDNPSNLFDFDDIINKQTKSTNQHSEQSLLLNNVDLSFKSLDRPSCTDVADNFTTNDLLMVNWDSRSTSDRISDVGPLNLAGPQDLSLGFDKRKFFCTLCASVYTSELGHVCKSTHQAHKTVITSEPLNLKSQPLDLTTGPIYLAMDGSLSHQPILNGAPTMTYDLLTKHTLSSARDKSEAFKKCDTCGKYLFSNSGYLKHKKQHAGKFRYVCEFCHKGFFDQTNLKTHIDSAHSKLKRYVCDRCNKSFFWKHHLKRHAESCKGTGIQQSAVDVEVAKLFKTSTTTQSLPVISNFLLSLRSQSDVGNMMTTMNGAVSGLQVQSTLSKSGLQNLVPPLAAQKVTQCSLSSVRGGNAILEKSSSIAGGLCFIQQNDFSKYLKSLPGIPSVVTNGNHAYQPSLTLFSLQPQTAIIQLQNVAMDTTVPVPTPLPNVLFSNSNLIGQAPLSSSSLALNVLTTKPAPVLLSSSVVSLLSSSSSSTAMTTL